MIKETITSLFGTVRERLSNPFLGAFILSWAAINWRILYTILHPLDTAAATIQAVDAYGTYWLSLFLPGLMACFYVLAYPWVKFGIFYLQSIPTQKLRMSQFQYEASVLNAKRNVLRLESDLSLIRLRSENTIEIEKLQAQDQIEAMKLSRQHQNDQQKLDLEYNRRRDEANLRAQEQQGKVQVETLKLEKQFHLEELKIDKEHSRRMAEMQLEIQLRSRNPGRNK